MNAEIRDHSVHHQLRTDLIKHIWERFTEGLLKIFFSIIIFNYYDFIIVIFTIVF